MIQPYDAMSKPTVLPPSLDRVLEHDVVSGVITGVMPVLLVVVLFPLWLAATADLGGGNTILWITGFVVMALASIAIVAQRFWAIRKVFRVGIVRHGVVIGNVSTNGMHLVAAHEWEGMLIETRHRWVPGLHATRFQKGDVIDLVVDPRRPTQVFVADWYSDYYFEPAESPEAATTDDKIAWEEERTAPCQTSRNCANKKHA